MERENFRALERFTIKDIEVLTDIKAHTLRIWEQRYDIIRPKRTDTNIRYYDADDLKLLLNISVLNQHGVKISSIAEMSKDDIGRKVAAITLNNFESDHQIKAMVYTMLDLNEDQFEKIVMTNILQKGFEACMIDVIFPFMSNVGILWLSGSITPAHEHFISNIIRQKLIVAIDGQVRHKNEWGKKFVLYLPENEYHELGLLFSSYLIKARGHHVVYLGQSVPVLDLPVIAKAYQPDYFFTAVTTSFPKGTVQDYVNEVHKLVPDVPFLFSGREVIHKNPEFPTGSRLIKDFNQLVEMFKDL
jgi:DNA-binding transcriptional MerR regulator